MEPEQPAPGGAGRGGGLLFAAVLAFTAFAAGQALSGVARLAVVGALAAAALWTAARTSRRR